MTRRLTFNGGKVMTRLMWCSFVAIALCAPAVVAAGGRQTQKAPPIVGTWRGTVTADIGEMRIEVTLTEKDGKISGVIANPHGDFVIAQATLVDSTWELPFAADDGSQGVMKGKVAGDDFTGEWDFRPRAVGTFTLKRVKPATRAYSIVSATTGSIFVTRQAGRKLATRLETPSATTTRPMTTGSRGST
jgi:hypothetical protein